MTIEYQDPIRKYTVPPHCYEDDYPVIPLTVDNGITIPMTVRYPAWYRNRWVRKYEKEHPESVKTEENGLETARNKMYIELQNNKLVAKKEIPARQVLITVYTRENITGFSDIDYKPAALRTTIEESATPNCGIVEEENTGNLVLMSLSPIPKGDVISANFKNSRYLKTRKKDKPDMDSPTLDRMTDADHLNMYKASDWGTKS